MNVECALAGEECLKTGISPCLPHESGVSSKIVVLDHIPYIDDDLQCDGDPECRARKIVSVSA